MKGLVLKKYDLEMANHVDYDYIHILDMVHTETKTELTSDGSCSTLVYKFYCMCWNEGERTVILTFSEKQISEWLSGQLYHPIDYDLHKRIKNDVHSRMLIEDEMSNWGCKRKKKKVREPFAC